MALPALAAKEGARRTENFILSAPLSGVGATTMKSTIPQATDDEHSTPESIAPEDEYERLLKAAEGKVVSSATTESTTRASQLRTEASNNVIAAFDIAKEFSFDETAIAHLREARHDFREGRVRERTRHMIRWARVIINPHVFESKRASEDEDAS